MKPQQVLAVASEGGHWVQLLRLSPAFEGTKLHYATTNKELKDSIEHPFCTFNVLPDGNFSNKFSLFKSSLAVLYLLVRIRPSVIITTGAAPGFFAVIFGKLLGARTVWIDSIANSGQLSLAGNRIGRYADLWLTQWPHLARPGGPVYLGSVI